MGSVHTKSSVLLQVAVVVDRMVAEGFAQPLRPIRPVRTIYNVRPDQAEMSRADLLYLGQKAIDQHSPAQKRPPCAR